MSCPHRFNMWVISRGGGGVGGDQVTFEWVREPAACTNPGKGLRSELGFGRRGNVALVCTTTSRTEVNLTVLNRARRLAARQGVYGGLFVDQLEVAKERPSKVPGAACEEEAEGRGWHWPREMRWGWMDGKLGGDLGVLVNVLSCGDSRC